MTSTEIDLHLPKVAHPAWLDEVLPGATGRGVAVGLIDSGLDPGWRDSKFRPGVGILARGSGFTVAGSDDWEDRIGHGTQCTSIIHEMAPGAEIVPIRVFDERLVTSVEVLIAAVRWAVERRLPLVNLSLGTHLGAALKPLYLACEEARRSGTLIVAAVDSSSGSYPAVFANVLGVQAGRFENAYDFRFRPDEAIECIAPGRRCVRDLGGEVVVAEGGSFAAPHVTALVARFLECHPNAGLEGVRSFLARYATGEKP